MNNPYIKELKIVKAKASVVIAKADLYYKLISSGLGVHEAQYLCETIRYVDKDQFTKDQWEDIEPAVRHVQFSLDELIELKYQ